MGDPATAALAVTRVYGSTYTMHLEIRQGGGEWKITAFDQV
jgi:hypothetical protein